MDNEMAALRITQGDLRPIPDPTVLTTEQLHREINSARAIIDVLIHGLREVVDEKFLGVERQFTDGKVALQAALEAAKEQVGVQNTGNSDAMKKTEAAFTKQMDQIGTVISALQKALDDKIDGIKERIVAVESHGKGAVDTWAILFGVAGVVVAFLGAAVAVAAILYTHK